MGPGLLVLVFRREDLLQSGFDPYVSETKKQQRTLIVSLGLLALVLLLGFGIRALGVQRQQGSPALSKAVPEAPPVLAQRTAEAAPALPIPAEKPVTMPQDIYDWLEHLRRTDEKRKDLSSKQIGELMGALAKMQSSRMTGMLESILGEGEDPETVREAGRANLEIDTVAKRKAWDDLQAEFLAFPAPAECLAIQNSYSQSLGETGGMMFEILDSLRKSQDDPEGAIAALTRMKGTSSERIDTLSRDADRGVQDVCDKYKTRKWFSLAEDVGGGIMGQLGGLGL